MFKPLSALLLINSISIVLSFDSTNWILASNSSCDQNATKESTELLLKCDKLITPQVIEVNCPVTN